jgi:hypothetical protein
VRQQGSSSLLRIRSDADILRLWRYKFAPRRVLSDIMPWPRHALIPPLLIFIIAYIHDIAFSLRH